MRLFGPALRTSALPSAPMGSRIPPTMSDTRLGPTLPSTGWGEQEEERSGERVLHQ